MPTNELSSRFYFMGRFDSEVVYQKLFLMFLRNIGSDYSLKIQKITIYDHGLLIK